MKKCKVKICLLGHQRHLNDIDKLSRFSSKLFEIADIISVHHLPAADDGWGYTDKAIASVLERAKVDNSHYDLCICFIEAPIEDNYFSRQLDSFDSKTVLCSFYGVEEIFRDRNIPFFNYVHYAVLFRVVQIITLHDVNESVFVHDETRQCLFDMCGIRSDISFKCSGPKLCSDCLSIINKQAVSPNFIPTLEKEFKTFKIPLYYRIVSFVKNRPLLSILITLTSSVIVNVLSSFLVEWIQNI